MKDKTDEELEIVRSRAAGRTGLKGKLSNLIDPGTQQRANEAAAEMRRRAMEQQKPKEAPAAPKEFVFKKGGLVRGDGCAQRGKTRGRMV